MKSSYHVYWLVILLLAAGISTEFACRFTPYESVNPSPRLSRSLLLIDPGHQMLDSLINTNRIEDALEFYSKIPPGSHPHLVHSYLIYKLNKSIFFHNYFYPCEILDFVPFDSLAPPFDVFNRHYALNELFDEDSLKIAALSFIKDHHEDHALVSEMYSEIGRFYMFEGNQPDSSDLYFSLSLETSDKGRIASYNDILTQRALVYIQIAIRKDHKTLGYAENLFSRTPPGYRERKDNKVMQVALKAFCYQRLNNKKMGDELFESAVSMSDSIPCTYHQQEVFKLLLSVKSYFSNDPEDVQWVYRLDSIVNMDGDFCNYGKVKGEFYFWREIDIAGSGAYLQRGFTYILENKPVNTFQIFTVIHALYRYYLSQERFDEALDLNFSSHYEKRPQNIFSFSLEEALAPRMLGRRYYYIQLESYASIFLRKYWKFGQLDDLLTAHRLIQMADEKVKDEFQSFDDQVLIIIHNSSSEVYETGASIALELYLLQPSEENFCEYLYWQEKNRSRILYRDVRMKSNDQVSKELYLKEQDYRKKINIYQRSGEWDSLMVYSKKLDVLFTDFYQAAGKEMLAEKEKISDINVLRNKLLPGQIYLDFHYLNGKPALLYLDKNHFGIKIVDQDSTLARHMQRVNDVQKSFSNTDVQTYQNSALYLFRTLLEDILGQHNHILYSAHFGFHDLNPESWVKSSQESKKFKDLDYLIYHYVWERTESLYMVETEVQQLPFDRILAFLHSDVQTIRNYGVGLKELPGNIMEKQVIDQKFPQKRIFPGLQCTKTRFMRELSRHSDVLHLGMHGYASGNDRSELYLLFRSSSGGIDTLYGDELLNYRFPPLVMLTACTTGKGKYITGEGVFSIARYFIQGGSHYVIRSLWDLDDTAAGLWVRHFYQQLRVTQDPVKSLREAKLHLIGQYPNFTHPYYWAGVI